MYIKCPDKSPISKGFLAFRFFSMNHRKVKASLSKDESSDQSCLRVHSDRSIALVKNYFDLVNAPMPTFEEGLSGTLNIVGRS